MSTATTTACMGDDAGLIVRGGEPVAVPPLAVKCRAVAERNKFFLSSDDRTGALLRMLAASKPGGNMLEIGAGVGVGAAWLLDGMDDTARLTSIELRPQIARSCDLLLKHDPRIHVVCADSNEWLEEYSGTPFDLVFVDTTVTKFERRELIFAHLAEGGLLIGDDLLPGDTWSEKHPARVSRFRAEIMREPCLVPLMMDWASGVFVGTYRTPSTSR